MTNMQAAIGLAQMEKIDDILALRREQMEFYYEELSDIEWIHLRQFEDWCFPVHWMMTITLDKGYSRDHFLSYMKNNGIDCRQMITPYILLNTLKVNSKRQILTIQSKYPHNHFICQAASA